MSERVASRAYTMGHFRGVMGENLNENCFVNFRECAGL